ncbi:hypothetical protein R2R35_14620 [Anaerocolumna sp. AGMB13020]|uniref:hypothetical protein n=1 Tax=Anaerocolumna sp. AGMB13020 TaxID=3081750 RepID=UPI0029552CD9|nr:hypothetical protein [Anaerocolumna sp. AGMB13020]WOO35031.1 hypothetical protein R2R35_14620 [Anaerocolumna sp. AGMB13020]
MIKKEIWIRVKVSEESEKVRAEVWELRNRFPGDYEIKIFSEDTKGIKDLPQSHQLSKDSVPVLIARFKEENVQVVEKEVYVEPVPECKPVENVRDLLERIADSLGNINDQFERLNDNLENVTGTFKGNAWINVSASVHEN